jgi:DNA-binding Lrp family transcriptional regulator
MLGPDALIHYFGDICWFPPQDTIVNVQSPVLDDLDRKIIHALYIDGRASFSRVAEVLQVSEQTVARRYRQLHGAGIVRVVGQLDSQRLGQSDWAIRVRCVPDAAMSVATALARRPDTAWVQLTSAGTEIFCAIRAQNDRQRTALLLEQLPSSRRIVGLEAYCLLHMFVTAATNAPGPTMALSAAEIERLAVPEPVPAGRRDAALHSEDWALMRVLADDGRATYRQLAERTNWHESTVRRRMDELITAGVLYFDLDIDFTALGIGTRAMLWMSVAPAKLMQVGEALARHPEVPFAAATTGPTNLVASVACRDDYSLFEYLTREIAVLEGVHNMETALIIRSIKRNSAIDLAPADHQ